MLWLIIGFILGVALLWMRGKNVSLTWYEWFIGAIGILLLLLTIQNFVGSLTEPEPRVAWMFLLVLGIPAVILLGLTWGLAAKRLKAE